MRKQISKRILHGIGKKCNLICFLLLSALFVWTSTTQLNWGLPYPMHPDERNMAVAVERLTCAFPSGSFPVWIRSCMNPEFFAYGQLPLYLAFFGVAVTHSVQMISTVPVSFLEATFALRVISVIASGITTILIAYISQMLYFRMFPKSSKKSLAYVSYFSALLFIFLPFRIQFAHFGTTESLLMCFYTALIFFSFKLINAKKARKIVIVLGIIAGLSLASKLTSVIFLPVPLLAIVLTEFRKKIRIVFFSSLFLITSATFFVLSSPHTFISWTDFMSAFSYESAVGFGKFIPNYTKQFVDSIPFIFQSILIFPIALGLIPFLSSVIGFIILPWKKKEFNLLRFATILYLFSQASIFAKWTRFMAPIFPLMSVFSILCILFIVHAVKLRCKNKKSKLHIKNQNKINFGFFNIIICYIAFCILIISIIIPGISYLSIYQSPDVRFQASEWIFKNVPSGSHILAETANVVDVPILPPYMKPPSPFPSYTYTSFDYYNLDQTISIQYDLAMELTKADYIIIPSRRVLFNYTCIYPEESSTWEVFRSGAYESGRCERLKSTYPILNQYYEKLFDGSLGFKQVAEFSSYPRIELFGKILAEFPDEGAEETWSVFDHPVIRIFKKEIKR